jgi:hypothetical protein
MPMSAGSDMEDGVGQQDILFLVAGKLVREV